MTAPDAHPLPAGWRLLAEGTGFVEGPVAGDGVVDFVSVNRGLVYRASLDGSGCEVLAEPGGGPNGAARDGAGRYWLVQNGARVMESRSHPVDPGIQIVDGSAVESILRADLNAPNDCAFGPDGRLWFTDPYGRRMPDPGDEPRGRVWAFDPATREYELIATGLAHPNGLCFSADDGLLYVSDTRERAILALEVDAAGVRSPRHVAELPEGGPDGMAFDAAGRLWVAATAAEGIGVLAPDGSWDYVGLGPSFPTNLCFGGDDLTTLVVTAARGGRVLAKELDVAGLPLHRP